MGSTSIIVQGRDGLLYWGPGLSVYIGFGQSVQYFKSASIFKYGPSGSSLSQTMVQAAAGTSVVDKDGDLVDRRDELDRTLDEDQGSVSTYRAGRIAVATPLGPLFVTATCYQAIGAMQMTNSVADGSITYNQSGFFVTSWNTSGNNVASNVESAFGRVGGGNFFYGFGFFVGDVIQKK